MTLPSSILGRTVVRDVNEGLLVRWEAGCLLIPLRAKIPRSHAVRATLNWPWGEEEGLTSSCETLDRLTRR